MNNEEYQNLVELLKQVLVFYAEKKNYNTKSTGNSVPFSLVEKDGGSQARFALNKIKEHSEINDKLEVEFVKNIVNTIDDNESILNVLKIINEYKIIDNENS